MRRPGSLGAVMNSAPNWLAEVLDILEYRRRTAIATAVGASLGGLLAAYFAPDLLPPNALVGAAVGLAAVLLAVAASLGVDSVDLTIRGARHVRAAGGALVAELPGSPDPSQTTGLADALEPLAPGPLRVAFAPVSRTITAVPRWTDALAVELSRRDHRVVVLDLASGSDDSGHPGVLEVVRDGVKLADAVRFDPELLLARLGPGADAEAALAAWTQLAGRLPSDVDVLLLSLPPVTRPGVLAALETADRVWLVACTDRTARVDLIAGLDAADRTGAPTEVVLLDPLQAHTAPASVAGTASSEDRPAPDPEPAVDDWAVDPLLPAVTDEAPLDEPPDEYASLDEPPEAPASLDAEPDPEPTDAGAPDTEDPDAPPAADDAPRAVAETPATAANDATDDDSTHDDPTDELPPLTVPGSRDGADPPRRHDATIWRRDVPYAGPEPGEDPVRVAAALQTLAQEVWVRDEEA